jgi:hypothetical protein
MSPTTTSGGGVNGTGDTRDAGAARGKGLWLNLVVPGQGTGPWLLGAANGPASDPRYGVRHEQLVRARADGHPSGSRWDAVRPCGRCGGRRPVHDPGDDRYQSRPSRPGTAGGRAGARRDRVHCAGAVIDNWSCRTRATSDIGSLALENGTGQPCTRRKRCSRDNLANPAVVRDPTQGSPLCQM